MDAMRLLDDGKLLSEYATRRSEEAFAMLVEASPNYTTPKPETIF